MTGDGDDALGTRPVADIDLGPALDQKKKRKFVKRMSLQTLTDRSSKANGKLPIFN